MEDGRYFPQADFTLWAWHGGGIRGCYGKIIGRMLAPEIEEKFNYLFKRLTNLHTNLHIIAYKDSPVLKTPKRFKEGLSNTSNESIAHSLFKEDGI